MEEEEFDPNELKLLPVLATDRNTRINKENELIQLRRQQKQLMKSSKRIEDPSLRVGSNKLKKSKLESSFYRNRGEEMRVDELSAFRNSTDSKSLIGLFDQPA